MLYALIQLVYYHIVFSGFVCYLLMDGLFIIDISGGDKSNNKQLQTDNEYACKDYSLCVKIFILILNNNNYTVKYQ
jgi:hypothetical protein